MTTRVDQILQYWFGHVEETILPSTHRTHVWFSGATDVDEEIKQRFQGDLHKAITGEYNHWKEEARSALALVIILDQFSRAIHRNLPQAFSQDHKALDICVAGIEKQYDHAVSLIERVFFYMPLMHAENLEMQGTSVQAYKMLVDLAFPETRDIFVGFLDYSIRHYEVIKVFGRFPQRNHVLGRPSTVEELEFLKRHGSNW